MSLKESHGNMYDWVTHMHSHLGGQCPHKCSYCYVQKNRFGVSPRYLGKPRLLDYEFEVNYGSGKIIFIEHMNDMFAKEIPDLWIAKILNHCRRYPDNQYIFQTKNPKRVIEHMALFPKKFMVGTTIETDFDFPNLSQAPKTLYRMLGIQECRIQGMKVFVTIEPALKFEPPVMVQWMKNIKPEFVNIGIDSKHCGLPEPTKEDILALIKGLQENNITVKKKVNLKRIGINMEQ